MILNNDFRTYSDLMKFKIEKYIHLCGNDLATKQKVNTTE